MGNISLNSKKVRISRITMIYSEKLIRNLLTFKLLIWFSIVVLDLPGKETYLFKTGLKE